MGDISRFAAQRSTTMPGFIIENEHGIKEAFAYERPFNDHTRHAVIQYAIATYGVNARLRPMSVDEEKAYALYGEAYFLAR